MQRFRNEVANLFEEGIKTLQQALSSQNSLVEREKILQSYGFFQQAVDNYYRKLTLTSDLLDQILRLEYEAPCMQSDSGRGFSPTLDDSGQQNPRRSNSDQGFVSSETTRNSFGPAEESPISEVSWYSPITKIPVSYGTPGAYPWRNSHVEIRPLSKFEFEQPEPKKLSRDGFSPFAQQQPEWTREVIHPGHVTHQCHECNANQTTDESPTRKSFGTQVEPLHKARWIETAKKVLASPKFQTTNATTQYFTPEDMPVYQESPVTQFPSWPGIQLPNFESRSSNLPFTVAKKKNWGGTYCEYLPHERAHDREIAEREERRREQQARKLQEEERRLARERPKREQQRPLVPHADLSYLKRMPGYTPYSGQTTSHIFNRSAKTRGTGETIAEEDARFSPSDKQEQRALAILANGCWEK
ncbi:uncharacterized protein LOC132203544 isoform X2 [Neocloeon triangulifer]|uniref:uncharacterized protein LOC132203544 isoform X2 n=1 Tax=Neocloeon triangulifer TaxID=2078957 RepID=UPI00286ECCE0|nr:uncharacterized protein LOC132203544 isoform X2 [Neocloeon triangulifer]